MFVRDLTGILMKIEEDPTTRYRFEVWFDYTRHTINTIAEGAMIAIPNFAGSNQEIHYSILEVTGILPMHYALGDDTRGYPGFVVEAARNAGQDWVSQDNASTEDTTKIKCVAIPTNLEIVEKAFSPNGSAPTIGEEKNLPMIGHEVHLLDTELTERVANLSLDLEHDNLIQIGALVRDPAVRTFLRVEELLKVHFGIFGFTGAGKSNLLSTIVRKLLTESQEPVKLVFFDLMSEYTGLLVDLLTTVPGRVISLGTHTVPESLLTYFAHPSEATLRTAADQYLRSTLLPKRLKGVQRDLLPTIQGLIRNGIIRIYQPRQKTLDEVINSAKGDLLKGSLGNSAPLLRKLIQDLAAKFAGVAPDEGAINSLFIFIEEFEEENPKLTNTALGNLDNFRSTIRSAQISDATTIPPRAQVTVPQIIERLNDPNNSALLVFQAHDPDALREFASLLIDLTYESRRTSGHITPLVSFIFDEADEFIPGTAGLESQKSSKAAAMTLARRGRKFGLGLGIATQRIRYLDTSIIAQPHTYFVSKLPRLSDRQAVGEAFGISEDMFRQTFKFKKGDWLLASYDAAGLESIPIPVHAENADDRILDFISKQSSNSTAQKNNVDEEGIATRASNIQSR